MFTKMRFNLRFVSTIIFVATFLVGGIFISNVSMANDGVDTQAPSVTSVDASNPGTIIYNFDEAVQLMNADMTELITPNETSGYASSLGIYNFTEYLAHTEGTAAPKTYGTITNAVLSNENKTLIITYDGILTAADYVVDAWGLNITDLAKNKVAQNINQKFTILATPDTTIPTAKAAISGNTITYTFSEPVQLKSQADGTIVTDSSLYKNLLKIYTIDNSGNYGPTTVPGISIISATLDASNILTITYSGNLQTGNYVVNAWGYDIQDLADNKIAKNDTNQVFTVLSQGGGDAIPEDTTKPDLASVDAAITYLGKNVAINYKKGVPIVTYVGEKVGALSAVITENSTIVNGTEGVITISGPLMGGVEATAPYGTFTVNGTNVVITPYPGNDVLAQVGTFTFKVAAGTIQDATGNTNNEISFTLIVFDITPPVITVTGTNPLTISQGSNYTDEGATATDNVDNNVTVISSGTVDTNTIGTYTITYNATDKATNQATPATRTVYVTDQTPPT